MTYNDMYAYVALAYPGNKWRLRVSRMEPHQVIAIYHSMQERAAFALSRDIHPTQKTPARGRTEERPIPVELQLTIWDIPGCRNL